MVKAFCKKYIPNLHSYFFYGFLITSVLTIRKVLIFYPILGQFNEYSGIYLYLSDIFLFLTLTAWGISILYNNKSYLSITTVPPQKECSTWNILRGKCGTKRLVFIPLLFIFWSFTSILWSNNPNLAFFRFVKFLELFGLYFYLISQNVSRLSVRNLFHVEQMEADGTILKRIFQFFIFIGVLESIIGIGQFIIQHSIGLFWLKESLISTDIPGVAKLILNGDVFIRSYGLFPHPDILGGFLLISIILSWQYKKLFHSGKIVPRGTIDGASMEQSWINKLLPFCIIIQVIALVLAFCKSAIIGTAIATVYIIWTTVPRLSRETKLFHVEQFGFLRGGTLWRKAILLFAILAILALITKPDTNSLLFKSLNERMLYQNVSRETISAHPIIGIGNGQFVANMQRYTDQILEVWQYQPVHNIFLLIWSELGIIGLGLFVWFLWKLFHACPVGCSTWNIPTGVKHETNNILPIFKGILLGFTFVMLFDHYLWDIQQGQIMLWLVMGIIASQKDRANN